MNKLTIVLAVAVVILILVVSCHTLWKRNREQKNKIEVLEDEIKGLKSNLAYLVKHIEEVTRIKNEADRISDKINGAKTDEEVADIVSVIISANNDRVQDN